MGLKKREKAHRLRNINRYIFSSLSFKLQVLIIALLAVSMLTLGITANRITEEVIVQNLEAIMDAKLEMVTSSYNQITEDLENLTLQFFANNQIPKALTDLQYADNSYEKYLLTNSLSDQLRNASLTSKYFDSIGIIAPASDTITYHGNSSLFNQWTAEINSISEAGWFQGALEAKGAPLWKVFQDQQGERNIAMVRAIVDFSTMEPMGVVVLLLKNEIMMDFLNQSAYGETAQVMLMDENLEYILTTENRPSEPIFPAMESKEGIDSFDYMDQQNHYLGRMTFLDNGWMVITAISEGELYAPLRSLKNRTNQLSLLFIGISCLFVMLILKYAVIGPLKALMKHMKVVEEGDLTVSVDLETSDEIGQLSRSFNTMVERLKLLISNIINTNETLVKTAATLDEASESIVLSTEKHNEALEEISVGISNQSEDVKGGTEALDRLNKEVGNVVQVTDALKQDSEKMLGLSQRGRGEVTKLQADSRESAEAMDQIAGEMKLLAHNSREIEEMIADIQSISKETNLLALNASIEAARAGESGRGFAVVAAEIRNLAAHSKETSEGIQSIIQRTLEKTASVEAIVENAVYKINRQNERVQETSRAFENINAFVDTLLERVKEMEAGVFTMEKQYEAILKVFSDILMISGENTAIVQEITACSAEEMEQIHRLAEHVKHLRNESDHLKDSIAQFKIINS